MKENRTPNYGLDAPVAVRNMLIVAALGIISLIARLLGVWSRQDVIAVIARPLMLAGLSCGAMAWWMIYASTRSIRYARTVLRAALNQAKRWNMVGTNAAVLIDPPRPEAKEIQPLDPEQARRLLTASCDNGWNEVGKPDGRTSHAQRRRLVGCVSGSRRFDLVGEHRNAEPSGLRALLGSSRALVVRVCGAGSQIELTHL